MNNSLLYKLKRKLYTVIGDLTWHGFKKPFSILYKPKGYKIKDKTLNDLNYFVFNELLLPGDIILRRYDKYFSSYFIPGEFKHAGIYIGKDENDNTHRVIHSISEGVQYINIFDFFKTDYICIIRVNDLTDKERLLVCNRAKACLNKPYDFDFRYTNSEALYCTELVGYCYEPLKDKFKFKLKMQGWGPIKRKSLLADNIILTEEGCLIYNSPNSEKFKVIQKKLKIEKE